MDIYYILFCFFDDEKKRVYHFTKTNVLSKCVNNASDGNLIIRFRVSFLFSLIHLKFHQTEPKFSGSKRYSISDLNLIINIF